MQSKHVKVMGIVGIVLMLFAIAMYVLSLDEADPKAPVQEMRILEGKNPNQNQNQNPGR